METVSSTSSNSTVTLVELKRSLVPPKWEDGYLADPGDMDDISAEDKWKLHLDITTYTVAAGCLEGLVTTVGPDYDSVALWVPPGKELDGWLVTLRSGLWRLYFQLSAEGRKRYFDEILPLLHETKASVLGDRDADTWYLVNLGTKPNSQGRGYARRLLEDMFHKVDAEDRPIYLESSSQANNAYYEKFGFEVKREISLTRGNAPVRLWIMVREPRPARKVAYHHHHHHNQQQQQSPNSPMMMKTKKFHGAGAVAGVKM